MFRWRELAIQHLPILRETIIAASSHVDLWQLLIERLSDAGVSESRRAEVKSIYDYAWWCVAASDDEDMAAGVGTFFYGDLPVYTDFEDQIPLYITPAQFPRLEPSFRYRMNEGEYADFRSRYDAKRAEAFPPCP